MLNDISYRQSISDKIVLEALSQRSND